MGRHLDGDIAIQARIPRLPHFAHAASADRRDHFIWAEFRAWHPKAGEGIGCTGVSRWRERYRLHAGRSLSHFGQKTIAALRDAFDIAWHLSRIKQGASYSPDRGVDVPRRNRKIADGLVRPEPLQNLLAPDRFTATLDQHQKYIEGLRLQFDWLTVTAQLLFPDVERIAPELKDLLLRGAGICHRERPYYIKSGAGRRAVLPLFLQRNVGV